MVMYRVLLGDFLPGHPSQLLKEFDNFTEAYYYGINEAHGYCQGKERPHVETFKSRKTTLITTPTDYYIIIREV